LEDQIEVLTDKLKKAEEALTAPSSPYLESPKTQSDDEYIVVESGSSDALEKKLEQREAEIRKAIAHAKKLEQMYNTAEERTLTFEKLVIRCNLTLNSEACDLGYQPISVIGSLELKGCSKHELWRWNVMRYSLADPWFCILLGSFFLRNTTLQVQVLEANMFEKFDDANALLEKVKELEELLTAGQIQVCIVWSC